MQPQALSHSVWMQLYLPVCLQKEDISTSLMFISCLAFLYTSQQHRKAKQEILWATEYGNWSEKSLI